MKRKELIQSKLTEKERVDFEEIHEDDKRSVKRMLDEEDNNLHDVNKQIKKYKQNHTLVLGDDFVALIQKKAEIKERIKLIETVKEDHV